MKLSKSQKRLFILLSIVIAYAVFDIITNKDQYLLAYFGPDKKSEQSANTLLKEKPLLSVQTKDTVKLNWARDPFTGDQQYRPNQLMRFTGNKINLKLQAITYSGENSLVMISDQILRSGDEIEGFRVGKIYRNKVELIRDGNSIFIKPN
jgi:hypothetical protein